MKNFLLCFFCNLSLSAFSQVHSAIPAEASSFYNAAMRSVNPGIKSIIELTAFELNSRNVNTDSLSQALKKDPLLKNLPQDAIDAITVLIMVEASKNADADLKTLVMKIRKNGQNEAESKKTQSILEHKSRMAENIVVLMKKIGAGEGLINNLK